MWRDFEIIVNEFIKNTAMYVYALSSNVCEPAIFHHMNFHLCLRKMLL